MVVDEPESFIVCTLPPSPHVMSYLVALPVGVIVNVIVSPLDIDVELEENATLLT